MLLESVAARGASAVKVHLNFQNDLFYYIFFNVDSHIYDKITY